MNQQTYFLLTSTGQYAAIAVSVWAVLSVNRKSQDIKPEPPNNTIENSMESSNDNPKKTQKALLIRRIPGLMGLFMAVTSVFMLARSSVADAPLSNGMAALIAMSLMLFASSLVSLLR